MNKIDKKYYNILMDILISIIMPCYNSDKYIHYAIESILKQTYKLWELIIVDDCITKLLLI